MIGSPAPEGDKTDRVGRKGNWVVRDDLRINFLCLAGAAIGAISITLEWLTEHLDSRRFGVPMTFHFDLMGLIGSGLADEFLVIASGLFLAGTLIAFITPTAGFLQLAGLLLFFGKVVPGITTDTTIGLGAIFGIVSTILVLYSLFNPVGAGIPQTHGGPSGNLLNIVCRDESFRLNALCVIGAGLAVIAIFLPWVSTTLVAVSDGQTYEYPATPIDYVSSQMNFQGVGEPAFAVAMSVLFAGVVISFITPAGGFIQIAGILMFYWDVDGYLMTRLDMAGYSFFRTELVYGFLLGLVGAGITVLSFFVHLDSRASRNLFSCERILTWTLPRNEISSDKT
jgi:hypothetical protein